MNTRAFPTSIGMDKIENEYLLTVQLLNPRAISAKNAIAESPVYVYTDRGKDIFEMLRKMTAEVPKRIAIYQATVFVFGEEFAREGVSSMLDYLTRDHAKKTGIYFVIAKGTTANSILNVLSQSETIPSNQITSSLNSSAGSLATTKVVKLIELINSITSDDKSLVLPGIEMTGSGLPTDSIDILKITKTDRLKFCCLGAFKKDKLVGWLNSDESAGCNYINGNVKSAPLRLEYSEGMTVTLEIITAKSKKKAYLLNDKPAVDVDIEVEGKINSVIGNVDVSEKKVMDELKRISNEKIMYYCNSSINKAQKELKSDIFGFGGVIHRGFPKIWDNLKDDWNNEFEKLPVKINVDVKIRQSGAIIESHFAKVKK